MSSLEWSDFETHRVPGTSWAILSTSEKLSHHPGGFLF